MFELLWSINDRLAGGEGIHVPKEIPNLISPLIDLMEIEREASEE